MDAATVKCKVIQRITAETMLNRDAIHALLDQVFFGSRLASTIQTRERAAVTPHYSRLKTQKQFHELLQLLNERQVSVMAMRYGLVDGKAHIYRRVAEAHGVQEAQIVKIHMRSIETMRQHVRQSVDVTDWGKSIDSLDLCRPTFMYLKRAGVNTIEELTARTEFQLLRASNIGMARLREIKQALAIRGLSLAG